MGIKKTPVKKEKEEFQGRIATKKLWKEIDIKRWYAFINRINPEGKWVLKRNSIQGCCPYHDDSTPSFNLNFDLCIGKCFGSCGHIVSDLVQFVAKLTGTAYHNALTTINTEFDLALVLGKSANELSKFHKNQEMKKAAIVAMREVMAEYIREKPAHLDYLEPAVVYLTRGRNVPLGLLDKLPVVVYPKPEHVKKYLPSEFHALYEAYMKPASTTGCYGSLLFTYNDAPGSISRLKLRFMQKDAAQRIKQYPDVKQMPQPIARDLCTHSFVFLDDQYCKDLLGVFGLHHYSRRVCATDANIYLTEGEFDALSCMVAQLQEDRSDFVILAAGGAAGTNLSFLREYGIRTVWLVQDSSAKNGDSVANIILKSKNNFLSDSLNPALNFKVFTWPATINGSDLDEAVQLTGYHQMCQYLVDERNTYFLNSYNWIIGKAEQDISNIRKKYHNKELTTEDGTPEQQTVAAKNNADDMSRDIRLAIIGWMSYIHDQADKLAYVRHFSSTEGIDISELDEVNREIHSLNTEEGAVQRMVEDLSNYIEFTHYERTQSGNQFSIWSKTQYVTTVLPPSESGMEQVLSQYIGKDVLSWSRGLFGTAPGSIILQKSSGDPLMDSEIQLRRTMYLLRRVMMDAIGKVNLLSSLKKVGQGIHYWDLDQAKTGNFVYFVNGSKAYRGKFNPGTGAPIEWTFVNSMVDDQVRFVLQPGSEWSAVKDVSDLYSGVQVDIKETYNNILKLIDGWKFEHHEIMREYIAAWIMSLPIQKAVGQVNVTFITGDSTSGKTSFARGLLGGYKSGHNVPSILECASCATDASPAAIYQSMDSSSLLLSLDEAESKEDTDHSSRVNEIMTMIYSIPTGGATTERGGITAEHRTSYFLRMPVLFAAIGLKTDPVFLTRVMVIYTKKETTRMDVGSFIDNNFDDAFIKKLRHSITTGLLHRIPEIIERKNALYEKLSHTETCIPVTSRFTISVLTVLTIYEMLGGDPVQMYKDIIEKNRGRLEAIHGNTFQSEILNAVLYSPSVAASVEDGVNSLVSPRKLILEGNINLLNNSDCGVYYLPDKAWIIIVWRLAKYIILRSQYAYRKMDEASFVESVSKNAYVIHDISAADHEYIKAQIGLTDIKNSAGYTVVSSSYLVGKEEQEAYKEKALQDGYGKKRGKAKKSSDDPGAPEVPIEAYEEDSPMLYGSEIGTDFCI